MSDTSTKFDRVLGIEERRPSVRLALTSLSLAMLLSSLGTSIANVALPTLAKAFNASFQDVQWVVLAYLLAITSMIVSLGRLGDVAGRRRLLLAGLALFTAASLACATASSLWLLIVARLAQGLGAAAMMALTLAFVTEIVPHRQIGSAMGLLGTTSAIGTALGPSLGGLLISGFGWRTIFIVNLPLGLLALFLVYRHLPTDRQLAKFDRAQNDVPGTLLLVLTLTAYALAMTLGRGHFGLLNLALLTAALVGLLLFIRIEATATVPLIRLALFREPMLRGGLAMSCLVSTVVMATLVVGPFYLSAGLALAPAQVGLVMSSGPIVSALTGVPAGRAVDQFGPASMTRVGLIAMAVGTSALAVVPHHFGVIGYVTPLIVITAGYALFQAANNTAVLGGLEPAQRGTFSGMLNLSRNLGLITGASVMGAVFALASGSSPIANASPKAVATGLHTTFVVAAVLVFVALFVAPTRRGQAQSILNPEEGLG